MIASVDTEGLLELVWAAPLSALIVAITYSVFIYGTARASERRRAGNAAGATAFAAIAAISGLAFAGTVVAGVAIIISR